MSIQTSKSVYMLFHNKPPKVKGLKFVLWKITDAAGTITHDWGFAEWDGKEWQGVEVPEGYSATVVWWSQTPDPHEVLLKEESKIIRI